MRRKVKFGAVLLMAGAALMAMESNPIRPSFCNLVESYQAVRNTHAPMGVWERFVYSFALARQRAADCKSLHRAA